LSHLAPSSLILLQYIQIVDNYIMQGRWQRVSDINRKIDCHSLFQTAEFFKVLFEFIVYLFVFQYGLISVTILRLIRYNE